MGADSTASGEWSNHICPGCGMWWDLSDYEEIMTKSSQINFRWAVCCQTCCHFHESPVATGEGECVPVGSPFEVMAGNICDLHKPFDNQHEGTDDHHISSDLCRTGH